jgi:phage shock protein PspC (stress-responsive transcriptional regulator)
MSTRNEGSVSLKSRLERSNTNRVIAGVCGGIAEYLAIDATLVRVVFIGLTIFGGIGLLLYVALLILMPLPGHPAPFIKTPPPAATDSTARMEGDSTITAPATVPPVDPAVQAAEAERRRMAAGYLLIGLGIVFLLSNAGAFRFVQWQFVWPLVLIGIGVLFLVQRVRT